MPERHGVHPVPGPVGLLAELRAQLDDRVGGRQQHDGVPALDPIDGRDVVPPSRRRVADDRVEPDVPLRGAVLEQLLEDRCVELVGKRAAPECADKRLVEGHDRAAVHLPVPQPQPVDADAGVGVGPGVGRRGGCGLDCGEDLIGGRRAHVHLDRRQRGLIEYRWAPQPFGNPHRAKRRRPVARHHTRPARVDLGVGCHHLAARGIEDRRQPFDGGGANPILLARPSSGRCAAVAAAAQGHAARHRVADVPVNIGVHEVLRRRREATHTGQELGPVRCAIEGLEPTGGLAPRFPAQGHGPWGDAALEAGQVRWRLPLGFGVEQRAVTRAEVLVGRWARLATHANLHRRRAERKPLPTEQVLPPRHVHVLDVEILHVDAGIGQPPRHPRVVADDDKRRRRQGDATDVEPAGHDVHFVPDRRHLDGQVRVVGQQWPARGAARRGHDPAVAAPGTSADVEPGQTGRQRRLLDSGGDNLCAGVIVASRTSGVRPGRRTRSAARDDGRSAVWPLAHQAAGFRGANGRRQPSADQLTPTVLGKAPRHQAGYRERVDRRPGFRRDPEGKKFRWASPAAHLGDGGIHAAAVLLESVAHQRRRCLPFLAGRTAQPQADEPLVHANRRRAEHFGEPAAGGAAVELHLPEPFATVQKPHGEPGVIGVTRVNVGHAVSVEEDLDGGRQPGKAHLAVKAGNRASEPEPGAGGKPNQDDRRQNEQPRGPPAAGRTRGRHSIQEGRV